MVILKGKVSSRSSLRLFLPGNLGQFTVNGWQASRLPCSNSSPWASALSLQLIHTLSQVAKQPVWFPACDAISMSIWDIYLKETLHFILTHPSFLMLSGSIDIDRS